MLGPFQQQSADALQRVFLHRIGKPAMHVASQDGEVHLWKVTDAEPRKLMTVVPSSPVAEVVKFWGLRPHPSLLGGETG